MIAVGGRRAAARPDGRGAVGGRLRAALSARVAILGGMAYDEALADRIRATVEGEAGLSEKKMFGGLAFLVNGNLAISASGRGGVLLRCDPGDTDELVRSAHVERFEMRGREMDGWLHLDLAAVATDEALERWAGIGVAYARSLPPK